MNDLSAKFGTTMQKSSRKFRKSILSISESLTLDLSNFMIKTGYNEI
jgi:hypothetical protein